VSATTALRFDGKVALVTGAGSGLGKTYALALAARGASVVVNDLGGDTSGANGSSRPAIQTVEEIRVAGGTAVADFGDVTSPDAASHMVETARREFGGLDVLINNAGTLDTAPLVDATEAHIQRTVATHLLGAMFVAQAALPVMLEQGRGRIVSTSSGAVFGSREGTSYQAAKAGIVGLTRSLAVAGAGTDVRANAVLPTAYTRMTSSIADEGFRQFMESRFAPERVASAVLLLSHESFPYSGECFLAGGGRLARMFLGVTQGYVTDDPSPEDFAAHLDQVMDTADATVPGSRIEEFQSYLPRLGYGQDLGNLIAPARGQS
jgi:NAD(P)-dependent dehydrogenase (short-subunit alcohol dehydrogenase family)